jgi:hypothetical protein
MRKSVIVSAIAAAAFALSAGLAVAQERPKGTTTGTAPRTPPSTTSPSPTGDTKGCPPGQYKKPGHGKCGPKARSR